MTLFVCFNILQSFPSCNLNRDDVGSPKTCQVGGVTRGRVSSQCFKRAVREALRDLGFDLAIRTRKVDRLLHERLIERNPQIAEEAIAECVEAIVKKGKFDNMTSLTDAEYDELAIIIEEAAFDPKAIDDKCLKRLQTAFRKRDGGHTGLDIALFGRMIATVDQLNVEGATSFNHAYTTHAITSGLDYFTAVDDVDGTAGHIDNKGFTAGVFYRYVSLNVDRLVETLGLDAAELQKAIEAFVKALYVALPSGSQHTYSAYNLWDYCHCVIQTGQPVQANFEKPVTGTASSGLLEPSIKRLEESLARTEKLSGSLYGKKADIVFGGEDSPSIDEFAEEIAKLVQTNITIKE